MASPAGGALCPHVTGLPGRRQSRAAPAPCLFLACHPPLLKSIVSRVPALARIWPGGETPCPIR